MNTDRKQELHAMMAQVRDETSDAANTAHRVGVALDELVDEFENFDDDLAAERAARDNADTALETQLTAAIEAEEQAREDADTALETQLTAAIEAEEQARRIADAGKQDVISDLSEIRSGAAAGATALQPSGFEAMIASDSDFDNPDASQKAKIPTVGAILDGADAVPTAGSEKLVKSGGVFNELALAGVYDVSAHNNNTPFASLSALLGNANLNTLIPEEVRKPGMNIKFINSVTNKYEQWRLMKTTWSNTVSDWQGVDEEPTDRSENLVKSSGVKSYVDNHVSFLRPINQGYINNGVWTDIGSGNRYYAVIKVDGIFDGKTMTVKGAAGGSSIVSFLSAYNPVNNADADVLDSVTCSNQEERTKVVPEGTNYIYTLIQSGISDRTPQKLEAADFDFLAELKEQIMDFQEKYYTLKEDKADKTDVLKKADWENVVIDKTETVTGTGYYFDTTGISVKKGELVKIEISGKGVVWNDLLIYTDSSSDKYFSRNVMFYGDNSFLAPSAIVDRIRVRIVGFIATGDVKLRFVKYGTVEEYESTLDSNYFLKAKKYIGYINANVWADIDNYQTNRRYAILSLPKMAGQVLKIKGGSPSISIICFLSEFDGNPVSGTSAGIIGETQSIGVGREHSITIPDNAKYLYLFYDDNNGSRMPVYVKCGNIDLYSDLQTNLSLVDIGGGVDGSITLQKLANDVKDRLEPGIKSYMLDEFVKSKDTLDNLSNDESCAIALMTDLHIVPNNLYSFQMIAVKDSMETVATLTKQFPIDIFVCLGDYIGGFTPDSKETGIRGIEKINEWISGAVCRKNLIAGNHEAQWYGSSVYGLTLSEFSALVANKYAQNDGYKIDYKNTTSFIFHYDDEFNKIRHIFINSFSVYDIDSTVCTQLASLATGTPDNYGILVYCHFGINVWSSGGYVNPVVYSYVANAISAIKNAISGTSKELICWLSGHTHIDSILVSHDTPVISLLRSAYDNSQGASQDGITYNSRIKGTLTEQTSTILTIRKDLGKLFFTRIGYGVDMEVNYNNTGGQTIGRVFNSLSGVVYMSDGITPISGANVNMVFLGATYTTVTNENGEYLFDKLPNESGVLKTEAENYSFTDIPLTINGSMIQNVSAD